MGPTRDDSRVEQPALSLVAVPVDEVERSLVAVPVDEVERSLVATPVDPAWIDGARALE